MRFISAHGGPAKNHLCSSVLASVSERRSHKELNHLQNVLPVIQRNMLCLVTEDAHLINAQLNPPQKISKTPLLLSKSYQIFDLPQNTFIWSTFPFIFRVSIKGDFRSPDSDRSRGRPENEPVCSSKGHPVHCAPVGPPRPVVCGRHFAVPANVAYQDA